MKHFKILRHYIKDAFHFQKFVYLSKLIATKYCVPHLITIIFAVYVFPSFLSFDTVAHFPFLENESSVPPLKATSLYRLRRVKNAVYET